MTQPALHPFLGLDESDRTHWLAMLFDAAGAPPPFGIRYPILRSGESPYTWLRDQFQKAQWTAGMRDRIRRSVEELLVTEAHREPVRDRAQVLGQLLEVAGSCGFTTIVETLAGWVRADAYAGHSYRLGQQTVPLRRTVWSILIAWRKTDELKSFLLRDFARPELGSQELCFVELGRLAPEEAIRRIPEVLNWEERYWREALFDFLSALGARAALAHEYRGAWTECLADIFFYSYKAKLLIGDPAPLRDVLLEAGLSFSPGELSLRPVETDPARREPTAVPAFGALPKDQIDFEPTLFFRSWDEGIIDLSNQMMSSGF